MALPIDQQNIISLLGIEDLPDEQKLALVDRIVTLLQKRLLLKILDSLEPEQRNQFEQLLDSEDQAGMDEFLAVRVPLLGQWIDEETAAIKQELAAAAKDIPA